MTTWTNSARRLLERYLSGTRLRVASVDVDADEVVDDLRHHIETELSRGTAPVITEQEVQRVIGRVTTPVARRPGIEIHGGGGGDSTDVPDREFPQADWKRFLLICMGIVLPLAALVIELLTGFCGIE